MKKILLSITIAVSMMLCGGCQAKVREYKVQVVNEYPHSTDSYTQGLFFYNGRMFESTGQYGSSTFRIVDIQTGEPVKKLDFSRKYFVEGSVVLGDNLYILTWESKVAFVYDARALEYKSSYSYPREGWGLTTDGEQLIASDGSSRLYFLSKDFKLQKSIDVSLDGRPVRLLNELEYIDGKIWANVYTTDLIVIINPADGKVEATVDCTGLLPKELRDSRTDVLNGIALDPDTGRIYLTGKYWKRLYEVKLVEKK